MSLSNINLGSIFSQLRISITEILSCFSSSVTFLITRGLVVRSNFHIPHRRLLVILHIPFVQIHHFASPHSSFSVALVHLLRIRSFSFYFRILLEFTQASPGSSSSHHRDLLAVRRQNSILTSLTQTKFSLAPKQFISEIRL